MSQPLGRTIGNAIEVREALDTLQGRPGRFRDFCLLMAEHALEASGKSRELASQVLDSGAAMEKCDEWFAAQGAAMPVQLASASSTAAVTARKGGWIAKLDAEVFGLTAIGLGAGRKAKGDLVDPSVGIELFVEVGDQVEAGDPICKVFAKAEADAEEAASALGTGVSVSSDPVDKVPLILRG
jgi:thymidine phosphorylase